MNMHSIMVLIAIFVASPLVWGAPRVLIVSPEQSGLYQTGGLAHATTGLAIGLNRSGAQTDVLMPYFTQMGGPEPRPTGQRIAVALDWRDARAHKRSDFAVLKLSRPHNPTLFLRHETIQGQVNYFDNAARGYGPDPTLGESYGAFGKAAAEYILTKNYDLVLLNDWTTGLIALHLWEAKLRGRKVPKVIFAIHNIAYQGNYPYELGEFLGLDPRHFTIDGYEFYGRLSFLKAGMLYSDVTYTVSRQYSQEITTPRFGAGMDGVARRLRDFNRLHGFLNGITEEEWDPARPVAGLPYTFTMDSLADKKLGKEELQRYLGLPVDGEKPLFILTSRLAEQKGYEYLPRAIAAACEAGDSQWAIIGDGDAKYVDSLLSLQERFADCLRYRPFSGALEKFLTRYADFSVNGAWFEPSGLNQFFSMKNGTIPVVSAVGGLVDSVQRGKTGFLFDIVPGEDGAAYDLEKTAAKATKAFRQATKAYADPKKMNAMRVRAMAESHSWESRVREDFLPLFESLVQGDAPDCRDELLP